MTTQKQISHLSFAAIILVFAALPALAQTGTVDNQSLAAPARADAGPIPDPCQLPVAGNVCDAVTGAEARSRRTRASSSCAV